MQPAIDLKGLSAVALPSSLLLAAMVFVALAVAGPPDAGAVMTQAGFAFLMSSAAP